MKYLIVILSLFTAQSVFAQKHKTEHVILVTFDGYRWQELFTGAEDKLLNNPKWVKDSSGTTKQKYWGETPTERRMKLMPFLWGTIAHQGTIIGNRKEGSKMSLTNLYKFSFPGYSELFSGHKDPRINSNEYGNNPNQNIFDFLAAQPGYEKQLVAIANWDAFPHIINSQRNGVPVYVNFKTTTTGANCNGVSYDTWETTCPPHDPWAMVDTITYHFAKEYLHHNHPKFAFIGFDETDHFAHEGKYDAYLAAANRLDSYMQDLWNMLQSDPEYKDKTTLILTCDHGRGLAANGQWRKHGPLTTYSHQTWMAVIGPDTPANGELKKSKHYHTNQVAATVAKLLGKEYKINHHVGRTINIVAATDK